MTALQVMRDAEVFSVCNDEALVRFLNSKKASTASTYRNSLENYFLPFLAEYTFEDRRFRSFRDLIDAISLDFALPVAQKQLLDQAVLQDYVQYLNGKDLSPKSVALALGAVQSAAKFWRVNITTKDINLPDPVTLTESYDWNQPKVALFNALLKKPVYRAFDAFAYQSGLAFHEISERRYRDIQEDFERGEIPCFKVTRQKTNVQHHTCVGPETVLLLRAYFDSKYGAGNVPEPNELLFPLERRAADEFYSTRAHMIIGDWPHSNPMGIHSKRKAFRNALVGVGGCPSEYAEYFMGHELGDIKKTYSTRGVDGWRGIYKKYVSALQFDILDLKSALKLLKNKP